MGPKPSPNKSKAFPTKILIIEEEYGWGYYAKSNQTLVINTLIEGKLGGLKRILNLFLASTKHTRLSRTYLNLQK